MKNNVFLAGILSLALVFGMTVIGCDNDSTDDGNNNGDPNNNTSQVITDLEKGGQIYQSDFSTLYTGSGTIKISLSESGSSSSIHVDVGTVAGGKVTLNLSAVTVEQKYLGRMDDKMPTGVTVSPADVMSTVKSFSIYEETTNKGTLRLGKVQSDQLQEIIYMYLSANCSITGTYVGAGGWTITYQIKGTPGWNRVYLNTINNTSQTYTTDLSGVPADSKWILVSN